MSVLYLPQQDETEILVDDDGNLFITQKDELSEIDHIIKIKPMYIDSFLDLLITVINEA